MKNSIFLFRQNITIYDKIFYRSKEGSDII